MLVDCLLKTDIVDTKSEKYYCEGITERWAPLFLQTLLVLYKVILVCFDLTCSVWLKP